jgi:hypothetical protein
MRALPGRGSQVAQKIAARHAADRNLCLKNKQDYGPQHSFPPDFGIHRRTLAV